MIMCRSGLFSYIGETPQEAYKAYLDSDCDYSEPCALEWYKVSEMKLTMTLEPREKPPAASKAQKKSPKKYLAMV